jgi:hypothetical protein
MVPVNPSNETVPTLMSNVPFPSEVPVRVTLPVAPAAAPEPTKPKLNVSAKAAGVIARATAIASKAIENFFIIPPGVAPTGIDPIINLWRVGQRKGPLVSMVYST